MRKVTKEIALSFKAGESKTVSNTHTDGYHVFLHGNRIISNIDGKLFITLAGWDTPTTRERINGILSVLGVDARVFQKWGKQYLEGADEIIEIDVDKEYRVK